MIPVILYVSVSNMHFLYWWCVRYQAYVLSEIFQVDNLYNMNKVGNCVREDEKDWLLYNNEILQLLDCEQLRTWES